MNFACVDVAHTGRGASQLGMPLAAFGIADRLHLCSTEYTLGPGGMDWRYMSLSCLSRITVTIGIVNVALGCGCGSSEEPSGGGGPTGDDGALCASALFCDDFEEPATGSTPSGAWTSSPNGGIVTIEADRAFRGKKAIKATTFASAVIRNSYKEAFASLNAAALLTPNTPFYGRMMYYLEGVPSNVHWTFIDATGPIAGTDYSATYRYGGQQPVLDGTTFVGSQLMANYETPDYYAAPPRGPLTDCYQNSDGEVVTVGTWSCAEWFFDGPNMEMRFWLDGREITSLHVTQSGVGCQGQSSDYLWTAPEFNRIDVGWESYQTDEERSIWIDDVVISSSKIGCPAAP